MIASLSGTIIHSGTERLVVEVGGVGLAVTTSAATCAAVSAGQHVSLATTLVVREDSLTLFGFLESSDRDVFEILQSVSGFGSSDFHGFGRIQAISMNDSVIDRFREAN